MDWKIENKNVDLKNNRNGKYHPVVLGILERRGINGEAEIENYFCSNYESLGDPFKIKEMEKAVERIISAKENPSAGEEKIAIFGDYDADGVTASAILYEVLKNLGFENVINYIPDRQMEGYGMNIGAVEYLARQNVKLIITVDCGVANFIEVEKARDLGIDVIITDHHSVLNKIPNALATINPNIPDSGFDFKELSGAGVAFRLAQALYQKLDPKNLDQLKWLLDLVSIGTIADCVPLLNENRVMAKYGLIVISKTRRAGLQELFRVGRMDITENNIPSARQVAFQIAPRINAAGRMDHANAAYKLLIEKDIITARDLALDLEDKNQKRQKITAEIFREVEILARNSFRNKKLIFASNPHWPVGILGLVAGKITDEFKKPTIIFNEKKETFVGSLRSIPEINIVKILEKCSRDLLRFGGHSQAAGVTVASQNIEKFYKKISNLVEKEFEGKEICLALRIDCELKSKDISWELVQDLKKMEPFGTGNEQPKFCSRKMKILDMRVVGNGSKHLKLSLKGEDTSPKIFEAIGFSLGEKFPNLQIGDKIDVAFNLEEDEWNGNKKIQLKLMDLKISE